MSLSVCRRLSHPASFTPFTHWRQLLSEIYVVYTNAGSKKNNKIFCRKTKSVFYLTQEAKPLSTYSQQLLLICVLGVFLKFPFN